MVISSITHNAENNIRRLYQIEGKSIGRIRETSKKFLIELEATSLDKDKQQKIEAFFDALFNEVNQDIK